MTYYDLLKQYVSTGLPLNERQFDKIKNDGQLLNSYFYSRNKVIDYNSPTEYEVAFIDKNPKYFKKFDKDNLIYFMEYSSKPDELAKLIINAKGDMLDSKDIYFLLGSVQNPDEIAKLIIKAKGDKLNSRDIEYLMKYSKNPDELAKLIGMDKVNKALYELDSYDIRRLHFYSPNPNEIKKLLIQAGVDREKIPN